MNKVALLAFTLLASQPFLFSAAQAESAATIMAVSPGRCIKSHKALGDPKENLDHSQVAVDCNVALVEDYPNGVSLSQFGNNGQNAPEIGFVTKRDRKRSDSRHFYGEITQVIYEQKRLPVQSGWCMAEMTPPKSERDKEAAKHKTKPKEPDNIDPKGSWKASCVAIASAKEGGKLKKFVTNINFVGSLLQPLPQVPLPTRTKGTTK